MRRRALLSLLCVAALLGAHQSWAVDANPVPGSVWTYLGPTFGADWTAAAAPPLATVTGYYYGPNTSPTVMVGSPTPSVVTDANWVFAKHFNTSQTQGTSPSGPWQHPTLYSVCYLDAIGTDTNNNACRGFMSESIAQVGGYGTFVEGGKFVGIEKDTSGTGGGAYGAVLWGQSWNSQFTIGAEAQTIRTNGTAATGPNFFNKNYILAGFIYSNGGSPNNVADAGFLINPYNVHNVSQGFYCPQNTIEQTAGVCFGDSGGSEVGIDLSVGGGKTPTHGFASIILANTDPVYIHKTDGSLVNVLVLDGSNILDIGSDPAIASIIIGSASTPLYLDGPLHSGASLGVNCGPGAPTASFASVNGIVVHC